jgi:hypothetical protein
MGQSCCQANAVPSLDQNSVRLVEKNTHLLNTLATSQNQRPEMQPELRSLQASFHNEDDKGIETTFNCKGIYRINNKNYYRNDTDPRILIGCGNVFAVVL